MSRAALDGCYVISLRPVGGHAGMRRAAAAHGARVLALSPWTLSRRDDAATRAALRAALAAQRVVFTSPEAVQAARALRALRPATNAVWCAVGAGTAAALRRAGVARVETPMRMDSEGLLDLPALQQVRGLFVGLVTAPGGRDLVVSTLHRRDARILRADVYARIAVAPSASAVGRLQALETRPWLALSSGAALEQVLSVLPSAASRLLRRAHVVAASERLAQRAHAHGFGHIVIATSARPRDLLAAAAANAAALA